ncbi:MAG TPA: TadE/TadG family type IV pilus assembly protein [Acetobacteraceae bacterium]|nr:TadE/TadG family type IV pilus assembly protein [Acetobacteraceae bacterium]
MMRWLRQRCGSVTMMTGLMAIPLVAMIGLAIDLTRVWLVRSRLQMSLDAAVLVAARDLATGGTSADGLNLFWANWGRISKASTEGFMGATATTPVVANPAPGGPSGSVRLTSTATVSPTLLGVLNVGLVTVSAASTAQSAAYGLELALVLDNTGSMAGSSITSLISSSNQLLGILYGPADTQPNLWVSVVPFSATVNVGTTHTNWLVGGAINQAPYSPSTWMGCVMARTAKTGASDGDDFNDKKPADAPFQPFLYPSTFHLYPSPAGIQYTTGTGKNKQTLTYWYPGDNDWQSSTWTKAGNEPDASNNSVGPNLGCPSLTILPETASKAAVATVLNKMVPVYRGGTIISLGLQAGWWTISPTWRGLWGDPAMPLAYNTPYMRKAIVLMTDGNNDWYDWPDGVPGKTPPAAPPAGVPAWTADGDADLTAYGRLLTNTRGVAPSNITATLNGWMSQMCTTIKANGITIYTILFNNGDSATQTLFRNCASTPADYFLSPTTAALQTAFRQIGKDLSTLRLSQ